MLIAKIRSRLVAGAMLSAALLGTTLVAGAPSAFASPAPIGPAAVAPSGALSLTGSTNLGGGWRMNNNQAVFSPDGKTELVLLRRLLEVWVNGDHVWTAAQSSGGDFVTFQHDGNLVVYTSAGQPVWASHTEGICGTDGCHLAIENTGNVAVEDDALFINYWETGTG